MCPGYTIGANETRLGIVVPSFFQAAMRNVISRRETETALTLGTLFTTAEALKVRSFGNYILFDYMHWNIFEQIGLIDELAVDKAEAISKCEQFLIDKKIAPQARSLTKLMLRQNDLTDLIDNRKHDLDLFVSTVNLPNVQEIIKLYLQSLKKK